MIRIYEWAEDSVELIKSLTTSGDTILDVVQILVHLRFPSLGMLVKTEKFMQ